MPDFSRRAGALIEVRQICAAAQRYMLAIVNVASIGQRIGSGAPSQVGPLFEQLDADSRFSERRGRRKPRQPPADYDHALATHRSP